jgi:hypothetical protein
MVERKKQSTTTSSHEHDHNKPRRLTHIYNFFAVQKKDQEDAINHLTKFYEIVEATSASSNEEDFFFLSPSV